MPIGGAVRQCSDNAHNGSRKDRIAERFVIEAHVAARYRYFKKMASLRKAFDGFDDLGHNLGPLRISEIEVIRCGDGKRANRRQIAAALRDDQLCSLAWIERAVPAVSIERHRDRFICAFDTNDRGIISRAGNGVCPYLMIVLLPDPLFGTEITGSEQRFEDRLSSCCCEYPVHSRARCAVEWYRAGCKRGLHWRERDLESRQRSRRRS